MKRWWPLLVPVVVAALGWFALGGPEKLKGTATGIKPVELVTWAEAQVGDCVWLDDEGTLFKVDCRTGYAGQRVVFHNEPMMACRNGDAYIWLQQDDNSPRLCMVLNAVSGDCFAKVSGFDAYMGQAVKVECATAKAQIKVLMAGPYDFQAKCPEETNQSHRYPWPPILLCVKVY
ncbi:hypothetical protein LFM09_39265 [Lentzea alba]|uniref:hypothetical protein n=1 Tax=Lentzea alba TaxID=2714351 RepID=UPI0039BFB8E8